MASNQIQKLRELGRNWEHRLGIQEIKTQNTNNIFRQIVMGQRVKREIWQFAKLLRSKLQTLCNQNERLVSLCGQIQTHSCKKTSWIGKISQVAPDIEIHLDFHELLIPPTNSMIQCLFAREDDVFLRRALPCRHQQTVKLSMAFMVPIWLKRIMLSLPSFVLTAEQSIF